MLELTMKRIQMNLKYLGYYSGEIDGIMGSLTLQAIKDFQKANGLTIDGIVGTCTKEVMQIVISEEQKKLEVTVDGVAGDETTKARDKQKWKNLKYFKKEEFDCKCGCGLNNMQPKILKIADKIREHYGRRAIVTSGTRCKAHNEAVGGVTNSRHILGKAIDMYIEGVSRKKL